MAPILEAEALREARLLAELLPGEDDLAVHHLLGWFHWFRHRATLVRTGPEPGQEQEHGEQEQDRPDLRIAVHSLTASFLAGEEDLPEPLLPLLAENAAAYAARLLPELRESNDPARISCAARLWERIVDAVPLGHPERPVHLTALGNVLRIKWSRGGRPADLDSAIDRFREALSALSEGPGRPMYLYNLGEALNARFERTGAIEDLEGAVALLGAAVRATPGEGLYRALVLTGLAGALRARYERAGAPRDLDGAIARYREAVSMFPADHPGRVESLSHLGDALLARFDHAGDPADRDAALTAWSAAKATADIL
ncbi:tetratricopeptide repeat protein [Streptomyces roseus]|uniref:tetratricopeptide repeat protein n=1 Tax=Streptomyces roseus TaxID=66430 RepID=UPI0033DD7D0A